MHQPPFTGRLRRLLGALALATGISLAAPAAHAQSEILWSFGPDAANPVYLPDAGATAVANLTVSEISRGNHAGTDIGSNTLVNDTSKSSFVGASGLNNAAIAVGASTTLDAAASAYFEVTLTPAAGFRVSVSAMDFGARRTNSGPKKYDILSSADSFTSSAAAITPVVDTTWYYHTNSLALSSVAPLTLRIYGTDATGGSSANWRIDDLKLTVTVTSDSTPGPTIANFAPATGGAGTTVTINGTNFGASPTVSFNGTAAPGASVNGAGTQITATVPAGATTGPITVVGPGGAITSSGDFTVLVQPSILVEIAPTTVLEDAGPNAATGTITLSENNPTAVTVTLTSSNPAKATVPATVVVQPNQQFAQFGISPIADGVPGPNATVTISASAAGYDSGAADVVVANADALPTSVVINKYMNSPDIVELLVIGDGTPGSTVDMTRMLIKDHSASMANDGGGKFRFTDDSLFTAVKAGTLIVLTNDNTAADTDPSDFVLRVGLQNATYFTLEAGTFDISTTEVIMIKGREAEAAGAVGSLHTFGAGAEAAQYTNAGPPKLLAAGTTGTGFGAIALNSTSSLSDYNGDDASGGVSLTATAFGIASNPENNAFIRQLRGATSLDGTGRAVITNGTAGALQGRGFFARNAAAQTVVLDVSTDVSPGSVAAVRITVPAVFGTPVSGNVIVTGAGAGTPVVSVSGQAVSVSGLAITSTNGATISLSGLTTPNPIGVNDDGNYAFGLETAGVAGSLTAVAANPVTRVIIPISSVRDIDAGGVPVDFSKIVALEGVCTEENFNTSGTSAFIQDGDFGVNVFYSAADLALTRNTRYAILGSLIHFRGLTEISPVVPEDVVSLGAGTPPAALTVSVPDLLANAEAYEGRLVRVTNLSDPSGGAVWGAALTVNLSDASLNTLDIRIQAGSTATDPPTYPVSITGVFGQFDSTSPLTEGYQLMPRDAADIEASSFTGYDIWAQAFPGIGGPLDDGDGDGYSNLLEYAIFGGLPDDATVLPVEPVTTAGAGLTLTVEKGIDASSDAGLSYIIEASADLSTWSAAGVSLTENADTIAGTIPLTDGRKFLRLRVTYNP